MAGFYTNLTDGPHTDLSYAAANKLGMVALGSAEVEMELLTEEEWRVSGNNTAPSNLRK